MKRIFIISRGYPTDCYKTFGVFEFDQAKALVKSGDEVVFLALDLRSLRRKRKLGRESFDRDGVHIEAYNIPCGRIPEPLLNFVRGMALQRLYEECTQKYGEPDIIHAHFLQQGYSTAQILKKTGIPLVMTEHSSKLMMPEVQGKVLRMAMSTYKHYDRLITVGKDMSNILRSDFGVDSIIIPNIVDTEIFSSISNHRTHEGSFHIITVGSLISIKNLSRLIQAVQKLNEEFGKCFLDIYGEGVLKKNLQMEINELGLTGKVTLHGLVERSKIAEAMENADCFALISESETFGVAYIEAFMKGLPVIATERGGPKDFVTEKNGILVNPDDENEIFEALKFMYKHSDEYDRKYIHDFALENFSPEAIANKINAVYDELLRCCKK